MKKLMCVIASGFVMAVNAQTTPNVAEKPQPLPPKKMEKRKVPPAEERAQKSVDELDKIVGLTADQKTKVYNLALNRAKSVDAVFEKYKGQPDKKEQAKMEIHQIRKNYRMEVKNILTPEQIEKIKQHHKANHPQNKQNNIEETIPAKDEN
ncbi:MAG: hypothetical protein KatS3mg027_0163 [Bacteroidia bacterium]|nr:MAG: hypothetical protein KatS3mg027_0163 [Bacteroidia bacterium]